MFVAISGSNLLPQHYVSIRTYSYVCEQNCELTFMPVIHSAEEMNLTVYFWAFDDTNSTIGASVGGGGSS